VQGSLFGHSRRNSNLHVFQQQIEKCGKLCPQLCNVIKAYTKAMIYTKLPEKKHTATKMLLSVAKTATLVHQKNIEGQLWVTAEIS
jgi:hypothetical protein